MPTLKTLLLQHAAGMLHRSYVVRGDLEIALQQGVMCIWNEQVEREAVNTRSRMHRCFVGSDVLAHRCVYVR